MERRGCEPSGTRELFGEFLCITGGQGEEGRGTWAKEKKRGEERKKERERDGGMRSGGGDRVGDDMAKSSLSEAQGASVASTFHQEPS